MPVAQWADEWLAAYVGRAASTQLRARSALNAHILPRFGSVDLVDVTRFAVQRMVHEIVACGLSPATAERTMRTLSLIMDAAVDARLLRDNPCRCGKAPRGQPAGAALPHAGGSRAARRRPATRRTTAGALRRLHRPAVGRGRRAARHRRRPAAPQHPRRPLPGARRPHGLRHSAATAALRAGVPVHVVSRRLGHADPSITLQVYARVLGGDDQDAADRIAAAIDG